MAPFIGTGTGPLERAGQKNRLLGQTFERAGAAGAVLDDGGDAGDGRERGGEIVEAGLDPGGVRLDDGGVAEAVDDDAGHVVGLGVDQPVERRVEERLAQFQRAGDARLEPITVDHGGRVAVEHPRGDLGRGVERRRAERLPV